jgi:hypothetical protein
MKYFELFNIEPKFLLTKSDIENIENKFLDIQKFIFQKKSNFSEEFVNSAYQTIINEVKRLEYLIEVKGFDIYSFKINQNLAEYIFNLRENLEKITNHDELFLELKKVKKELDNVKILLNEELMKENLIKQNICDLFSRFKCLNEILKTYNK